ncbi:MAG: MarR family transcriptional regulator [Clostridia bacterium]|nr:MarR family transcriptional regulator [Clostridia bacterium]
MNAKQLMETNDKMNRLMRRKFESHFINSKLTGLQALTLDYINANFLDHDVCQKEIERYLEIRGSSVSSLIDRLERDGYIKRDYCDNDSRYRRLIPTEQGKIIQKDISARIEHYANSLFTDIDEDELKTFEIVMLKILKNAAY